MHFLTTIGATICFSVFLFCIGYIVGLKIKNGEKISTKKQIYKSIALYLVYILISLLVSFTYYQNLSLIKILNILLIINPPEFAEFLISLSLFSILTIFIYKPIQKLIQRPLRLIIVTIIIFVIGRIFYNITSEISFTTPLQIIIENLWGYGQLHRFPIFLYLPIYILGTIFAYYQSPKLILNTFVISSLSILILLLLDLSQWNRWPPSILFLTNGIAYISLLSYIYSKYIFKYKINNLFSNIGKYPLQQFLLSTTLTFLPLLFFNPTSDIFLPLIFNVCIISALFLHPIVFHPKMV